MVHPGMQYYSAIKRNTLSSHKKTQRNPKCILFSERIQSESLPLCMIPTTWQSEKGKMMAIIKISAVERGRGSRKMDKQSIEDF